MRKAVIPAAGHGTRMRPVTLAVPKELLAVGTRPVLHLVLEEAAWAGLEDVAIVINQVPAGDLSSAFRTDGSAERGSSYTPGVANARRKGGSRC